MTARGKTSFVVRRGRMGRPLSLSLNLSGRGAKIDKVPVPVLGGGGGKKSVRVGISQWQPGKDGELY